MIATPIRMVVLDVDGTLLDPHETITPRVRRAVRAAMEGGCLVTLATGRRWPSAKAIAEDLGVRPPLILHGGSVVQDSATGAVIYQDPLEPETVAAIVETAVRRARQIVVFESPAFDGRLYAGDPLRDNEPLRLYEAARGPLVRLDDEALGHVRHVLSTATFGEPGELVDLREELARIPGTHVLRTHWRMFAYEAVEVFTAGCSKARALRHVADAHGIDLTEVLAIGDDLNDCEILAAVGLGVAMGNAVAEACAAARIQVASNAEDGVAEAIERFVLPGL